MKMNTLKLLRRRLDNSAVVDTNTVVSKLLLMADHTIVSGYWTDKRVDKSPSVQSEPKT